MSEIKIDMGTSSTKHAYLIMAHDNWSVLEKLLILLDDSKNDIYLHLDAKVPHSEFKWDNLLQNSNLTIIEPKPVYWADYSQVETTIRLLKAAETIGYSYYHLLSGADLPLKTNNERYSFFENSQKNFIGIVPHESWYSVRRVKYYHPLLHNRFYRTSKFLKGMDRLFEYGQSIVGVNRLKDSTWKIIDGWTWFSIRHDLCHAVIQSEADIFRMFHKTIASDELFIQTFVYNHSEYRRNLFDESDLMNGSMRYIDWKRGKPYIWGNETEKDFRTLINSPFMFARKFNEANHNIVDMIFNRLMQQQ